MCRIPAIHFLHESFSITLNGSMTEIHLIGNLFCGVTFFQQVQDLALARGDAEMEAILIHRTVVQLNGCASIAMQTTNGVTDFVSSAMFGDLKG